MIVFLSNVNLDLCKILTLSTFPCKCCDSYAAKWDVVNALLALNIKQQIQSSRFGEKNVERIKNRVRI